MKKLVSPQGHEIEGTNDRLLGTGFINTEIEDSAIGEASIEIEEAGETAVSWDSVETITDHRGMRQFIDCKANLVWECDLHFVDIEAGVTEPQRLFQHVAEPKLPTTTTIPQELDLGQLEDLHILIQRGIDDLNQTISCEADYTDHDRENAKATIEVGDMVMAAIRQATETLR